MRNRFTTTTRLLLATLAGIAMASCDSGAPWTEEAPEETQSPREDFGPSAAYDRLMLLVAPAPAPESTTAAIFDFAAVRESASFRRGARVRTLAEGDWTAQMDAGWEMSPMREPWRLVPYGDLTVVVGEEGEVDALTVRGEAPLRLEPGSAMTEYMPDGSTRLLLRQGRLTIGDTVVTGTLLDSQHGRALDGDVTATSPAPSARPGVEALLLDNTGFFVVFAPTAGGDLAWVTTAGQSDVRRGARLEPVDWEADEIAGDSVPATWRVASAGPTLSGELSTVSADHTQLDDGAARLSYVLVSGWIQDREVRREVSGLVRQIR
ncbi:MAG TPA: hypothetical protein VK966_06785 [Longimicrobiales bacterium]|nr:hypothetical protein [Longimicrobiales bacterium]